MLKITIPGVEYYDEVNEVFGHTKTQTLVLEHSLVSLSKWESRWEKPFLRDVEMTVEESIDYIRCMTITQNIDPMVYETITDDVIEQVAAYIEKPMTATIIRDSLRGGRKQPRIVTAELIYYWMFALGIPMECQKWHLNRLMTLIQVCNIEAGPKKKMSRKEIIEQNAAINEARKKQLNTKG